MAARKLHMVIILQFPLIGCLDQDSLCPLSCAQIGFNKSYPPDNTINMFFICSVGLLRLGYWKYYQFLDQLTFLEIML